MHEELSVVCRRRARRTHWRRPRPIARVPLALEGDMGTGATTQTGQIGRTTRAERQPGRGKTWLRAALADVEAYSETVLGMPLRPYQAEVARAVIEAIDERRGHALTVLMPRQSGKNQLS